MKSKHMEKVGGKMIFGGQVSRLMLGEVEDLWDSVALVMYPSRKAMFTMIQDPDYQASAVHRKAGLEGQLNIELKGDLGMVISDDQLQLGHDALLNFWSDSRYLLNP